MQVSQMKRAISQEQWKQRIVECRNSGVPVKEWCREQGISYSTYYRHEQWSPGLLVNTGSSI